MSIPIKNVMRISRTAILKHTPEILTGSGIAGMILAIVMAVKATPKAMEHIEEEQAETTTEKIKAAWKDYIPAAMVTGLSVACLISSSSVSLRRNTALAAAYKLSENAFNEYQDKVKATIGDRKEKEIQEEVAADKAKKIEFKEEDIHHSNHGNSLFIDGPTGQIFESNLDKVKSVIADINTQIVDYGFISQNEFLDALDCDLNHVTRGDDFGWYEVGDKDKRLNVTFGSTIKYGKPCFVMNYRVFINQYDSGE